MRFKCVIGVPEYKIYEYKPKNKNIVCLYLF